MSVDSNESVINLDDTLQLHIYPIDLFYIGKTIELTGFNQAIGISCDDGWGGMKHPFVEIEIKSNKDFNDYKAGEGLSDLFEIEIYEDYNEFKFIELTSLEEINQGFINLRLVERPNNEFEHIFEIKMKKSNNDSIEIKSENIVWKN